VANVVQVGFHFSTKSIKPSLKKVSPKAGFKRIFSAKSSWELAKSSVKLVIVASVAYPVVRSVEAMIPRDHTQSFWVTASLLGKTGLHLVRYVAATSLTIAVADWAYQRRSLAKNMKMSKQELKDEAKQSEGNPEVRGKIKSKALSMSRNRMLSMVGTADVVVVNPIHIAVALKYEALKGAPRVVAKGEGWLAEKIKEQAEQHRITIVESVPLARALYAAVDLEAEIGPEFYDSVARLLAFVHRLGQRRPIGGGHHRLPEALLVGVNP
jgi:flagellar biosynthetic protein FlhB